jgi:2'-5' RNA ligase
MRPGKRLFVGAQISVATANTLAGCAETLARRARDAGVELRWVAPANYPGTLAFLGWTGIDAIGAVCDALNAAIAGESRFSFRTTRLGAFPSLDRANVLWAGIEDPGPLGRLAGAIGEAMAGLGFRRLSDDGRPYHPHVTIARLPVSRAIREVVLPMAEQMFGDTRIEAVTLFESETKSSGSVYREVAKIAFKRARNTALDGEKRQTSTLERATPQRAGEREPERSSPDETQTDDGWPRGHHPDQGPTE